MPESPTANMLLVLPTEDNDADVWDFYLNTAFGLVDAHDHSAGKGVKVPTAGITINADLTFASAGGSFAATAMKSLDFTPTTAASITSYSSALFSNSSDSNNLYYRNSAGTNVKITDGSTLNISIVGGIGGDYTAVGALLSYDDASDSYWFQQQGSPRPWARMRSGDLDIYETAASIVNRVRLQSPSALAASYALTFPDALPGATVLRQVSSAGVETFSNTIAGNLTLTGTGHIVHGTETWSYACPTVGWRVSSGSVTGTYAVSGASFGTSTVARITLPPIENNQRILSIQLYGDDGGGNATAASATALETNSVGGGTGFTTVTTSTAADTAQRTLTVTTPAVPANDINGVQVAYYLNLTCVATGTPHITSIVITLDTVA